MIVTQKTIAKKFYIFLVMAIFLFFCSFSVLATNPHSWFTWGGGYLVGVGTDSITGNLFMGSNNPLGNINFTKITISVAQKYQPIVYNMDNDINNEVYLIGDKRIYQYDNNGVLSTEINLVKSICGNPSFAISDLFVKTMVVMTYNGSNYFINELILDSNGLLTLDETNEIVSGGEYLCEIHGGVDYNKAAGTQSIVFIVNEDNDVLEYDINDNSEDRHRKLIFPITKRGRNITHTFGGGGQTFIKSSPTGEFFNWFGLQKIPVIITLL